MIIPMYRRCSSRARQSRPFCSISKTRMATELSLKRAQMTTAWEDIKERDSGEIITTKVININKGGLIVEVNGIQGFLPVSTVSRALSQG